MNGKIIEFDKNSSTEGKCAVPPSIDGGGVAVAYRQRRGKSSFIGIRRDYSFMLLRAPPSLPSPQQATTACVCFSEF